MCEVAAGSEGDAPQEADRSFSLTSADSGKLGHLLEFHRAYLRRLVLLRMDGRLRTRIDPSDVIQETHLGISRRLRREPIAVSASVRVWLRENTLRTLVDLQRRHVIAKKRSIMREVSLDDQSSLDLLARFTDCPSDIARRKEMADKVREAMSSLAVTDREMLVLRHVEQLTLVEAGEVLRITPDAASKRYGRAILKLRSALHTDVREE